MMLLLADQGRQGIDPPKDCRRAASEGSDMVTLLVAHRAIGRSIGILNVCLDSS